MMSKNQMWVVHIGVALVLIDLWSWPAFGDQQERTIQSYAEEPQIVEESHPAIQIAQGLSCQQKGAGAPLPESLGMTLRDYLHWWDVPITYEVRPYHVDPRDRLPGTPDVVVVRIMLPAHDKPGWQEVLTIKVTPSTRRVVSAVDNHLGPGGRRGVSLGFLYWCLDRARELRDAMNTRVPTAQQHVEESHPAIQLVRGVRCPGLGVLRRP